MPDRRSGMMDDPAPPPEVLMGLGTIDGLRRQVRDLTEANIRLAASRCRGRTLAEWAAVLAGRFPGRRMTMDLFVSVGPTGPVTGVILTDAQTGKSLEARAADTAMDLMGHALGLGRKEDVIDG